MNYNTSKSHNKKVLSIEEEREYLIEIQNGNEEKLAEFIKINTGLVMKYAIEYSSSASSYTIEDLKQVGIIGMLKAIEKFDINRNNKFSTYAVWHIENSIKRELTQNDHLIDLPINKNNDIRNLNKQIQILNDKLKRKPTYNEIQEFLGITNEQYKKLEEAKIEITSLNSLINDDTDNELSSLVSSEYNLEEKVMNKFSNEYLDNLLYNSDLNDNQIKVLKYHYGIGCKAKTLSEIGKILNLSKERVRRIELSAIKKIKNSEIFKEMYDYPESDNKKKVKSWLYD